MAAMKKKYWPVILLAAVICFHLVNNYIWLSKSTDIVGVDVGNHLYYQLLFQDKLKEVIFSPGHTLVQKTGDFLLLFRSSMAFPHCLYWPNFVYLISSFFTLAFGASLITVKTSGLVYLLVLLFSIYAIGKKIGGRGAGLLAALLVSMYPLIFESSRQYGLDLPLTAIVCLACLFLLKAEHFTRLKYSALFGLACGAGMLIKGQFLIFLAAPLAVVLGAYFSADSRYKLTAVVFWNICVFVFLAAMISSLWWADKIGDALSSLYMHVTSAQKFVESGTVDRIRSLDYYLYNIKALFFDSLGVVFGVIFLASLIFFIRSKARYRGFILSWLFVPLTLFSLFFVIKHERFLMPVLPAIALVSAWGTARLSASRVKLITIISLVLFSLAQYYTLSYFTCWNNRSPVFFFGSSSYGRALYTRKPYYDREKLELIDKAAKIVSGACADKGGCKAGMAMLGGHISVYEAMYWMYSFDPRISLRDWLEFYEDFYRELPELKYIIICSYRSDGVTWPRGREFLGLAEKNRLVQVKRAEFPPDWENNFKAFIRAEKDFELVETLDFSNGMTWYIHKRKENR